MRRGQAVFARLLFVCNVPRPDEEKNEATIISAAPYSLKINSGKSVIFSVFKTL
jgi:hypothetical protein